MVWRHAVNSFWACRFQRSAGSADTAALPTPVFGLTLNHGFSLYPVMSVFLAIGPVISSNQIDLPFLLSFRVLSAANEAMISVRLPPPNMLLTVAITCMRNPAGHLPRRRLGGVFLASSLPCRLVNYEVYRFFGVCGVRHGDDDCGIGTTSE